MLNKLSTGTFFLSVSDANNCSFDTLFTIDQPDPLSIILETNHPDSTNSNGFINTTISGGTPPYSTTWDNGAETPDIANLLPGTYCLTITDTNNCTATACDIIYPYGECPEIQAVLQIKDVSCYGGNNGLAVLDSVYDEYSYQWSDGSTTNFAHELIADTYVLTITEISTNCLQIDTFIVTEPDILEVSCSQSNAVDSTNTASVEISVSGGVEPYTIFWSPDNNTDTLIDQNNSTFILENLTPGEYEISVIDSNLCEENCLPFIEEPVIDDLEIQCGVKSYSTIPADNGVACFSINGGNVCLRRHGQRPVVA